MADLGIAEAYQGDADLPGSVHLSVESPTVRRGGSVPRTADALVPWLNSVLANEGQRHNLGPAAGSRCS